MPLVRRTAITLTATGAALGLLAGPALACPDVIRAKGPTNVYDTAYGKVKTGVLVTEHKGRTVVRFVASGFPSSAAGQTLGVHVYQNKCGPKPADAGPHYQNPDAEPGTPLHEKEIWLDLKVGPNGMAHSKAVAPWRIAKGDAGSVVVHAKPTDHGTGDAGDRLLCTTVPFGR